MLTDFKTFFTDGLSKFATKLCLNIPPRLKHVATLPCEIWKSEKWRQSEICIVINDKSRGSIAKHLRNNELLYYTFITQSARERTFKIGEHLAKLQAKWWLLHFCPQRCWYRQISWITCVHGQKLLLIVIIIIGRLMWVYYQQMSNCCRPVLTYWQTDAISDLPTADHVRHFTAAVFLFCGSCVQLVTGFFIWPI